jgi:hypothetical protein
MTSEGDSVRLRYAVNRPIPSRERMSFMKNS